MADIVLARADIGIERLAMKKKLTWLAGAGAALASVAAVAVIFSNRGPDLEALAKEYQAAGMPWTTKDLPVPKDVNEGDNAAPLIRKAIEAWPRMRGQMEFGTRTLPESKKDAEAVLARLANLKSSLSLAIEAGGKPAYEPGWDWDRDLNKVVPELQSVRLMVRALCQRSDAYIAAGNIEEGMRDWKAALNLTLLSRTLPDSSAALLASSMSASVSRAAVRAIDREPKDIDLLNEVVSGLKKLDSGPDWRMAVKSDGYAYIATLRNSREPNEAASRLHPDFAGTQAVLVREGMPKSPKLAEMTGGVLKAFAKLGTAIESDASGLADVMLLAEQVEDEAGSGEDVRSPSSLSRSLRRIGASMGHAKAAYALALLVKNRADGGEEIKDLADLAGGPWLDPLSGLPLKFSYRKERIKIWSIGANLADDGGLSREEAMASTQTPLTDHAGARAFDEVAAFPHRLPQPDQKSSSDPHVTMLDTKNGGPAMLSRKPRLQVMTLEPLIGAHSPGHLGIRRRIDLSGEL